MSFLAQKYLEVFIRDFKKKQVDVSVLKGKVQLDHAHLNEEVLQSLLDLPPSLRIESATCGDLRIAVPWAKLRKEPVVVTVQSVSLVVAEVADGEIRPNLPLPALLKVRRSKGSGGAPEQSSTPLKRHWYDAIVENAQLSVGVVNVVVRTLPVDNGERSATSNDAATRRRKGSTSSAAPFLSLTLESLMFRSCNGRWQTEGVSVPELVAANKKQPVVRLFKRFSVRSISVAVGGGASGDDRFSNVVSLPFDCKVHVQRCHRAGHVIFANVHAEIAEITLDWTPLCVARLVHVVDGLNMALERGRAASLAAAAAAAAAAVVAAAAAEEPLDTEELKENIRKLKQLNLQPTAGGGVGPDSPAPSADAPSRAALAPGKSVFLKPLADLGVHFSIGLIGVQLRSSPSWNAVINNVVVRGRSFHGPSVAFNRRFATAADAAAGSDENPLLFNVDDPIFNDDTGHDDDTNGDDDGRSSIPPVDGRILRLAMSVDFVTAHDQVHAPLVQPGGSAQSPLVAFEVRAVAGVAAGVDAGAGLAQLVLPMHRVEMRGAIAPLSVCYTPRAIAQLHNLVNAERRRSPPALERRQDNGAASLAAASSSPPLAPLVWLADQLPSDGVLVEVTVASFEFSLYPRTNRGARDDINRLVARVARVRCSKALEATSLRLAVEEFTLLAGGRDSLLSHPVDFMLHAELATTGAAAGSLRLAGGLSPALRLVVSDWQIVELLRTHLPTPVQRDAEAVEKERGSKPPSPLPSHAVLVGPLVPSWIDSLEWCAGLELVVVRGNRDHSLTLNDLLLAAAGGKLVSDGADAPPQLLSQGAAVLLSGGLHAVEVSFAARQQLAVRCYGLTGDVCSQFVTQLPCDMAIESPVATAPNVELLEECVAAGRWTRRAFVGNFDHRLGATALPPVPPCAAAPDPFVQLLDSVAAQCSVVSVGGVRVRYGSSNEAMVCLGTAGNGGGESPDDGPAAAAARRALLLEQRATQAVAEARAREQTVNELLVLARVELAETAGQLMEMKSKAARAERRADSLAKSIRDMVAYSATTMASSSHTAVSSSSSSSSSSSAALSISSTMSSVVASITQDNVALSEQLARQSQSYRDEVRVQKTLVAELEAVAAAHLDRATVAEAKHKSAAADWAATEASLNAQLQQAQLVIEQREAQLLAMQMEKAASFEEPQVPASPAVATPASTNKTPKTRRRFSISKK